MEARKDRFLIWPIIENKTQVRHRCRRRRRRRRRRHRRHRHVLK